MTNLLFFCLAVALGIVGWLLGSRRRPAADTRIEEELRSQLANRDRELAAARTELTTLTAAHSTAEAAARAAEENLASHKESAMAAAADALSTHSKLEQELRGLREILDSTNTQLSALKAEVTSRTMRISELEKERDQLKAELTDFRQRFLIAETEKAQLDSAVKLLREQLATERQQLEKVQEQFRKDFEGISNRLLVETSSKFNEQSRKSLDEILSPLKENLGAFKESLEKTRVETSSHSALLKDQIARIGAEAANLTKALKGDVKTLGNWGENMLDQILEKSGLQEQFHYRTQTSAKDSEGSQRFLDVIIDLPESRHLIIDSKVSLRSYEEWCNAVDEPLRAECLQRHVDSLRAHIVGLSKKRYQESHGINAPDFVLMYIPIEPAFFAAVTQSPGLFSEALDKNVVLVTNSTLLATLRTVSHVWRLAEQQKNSQRIADRGAKLYEKFVGFIEDMDKVGRAIKSSHEAWESASNKLHQGSGNLVRQAQQLKDLGVHSDKSLRADLIEKAQNEVAPP